MSPMNNLSNSSTESNKITVAVFNGKNFPIWKFKMQAYLKEHGCWDVVEHGVLATVASRTAEKDAAAMSKIVLRVSDAESIRIMGSATAKDAWDKLVKEVRLLQAWQQSINSRLLE